MPQNILTDKTNTKVTTKGIKVINRNGMINSIKISIKTINNVNSRINNIMDLSKVKIIIRIIILILMMFGDSNSDTKTKMVNIRENNLIIILNMVISNMGKIEIGNKDISTDRTLILINGKKMICKIVICLVCSFMNI